MSYSEKNNELVREYLENNSKDALNELLHINKGIIYKYALRASDSLNAVEDLYQDGVYGFLKGLQKYNPDKLDGNPISYLSYYIMLNINHSKFHSEFTMPLRTGSIIRSYKSKESSASTVVDRMVQATNAGISLDNSTSLGRPLSEMIPEPIDEISRLEDSIYVEELLSILTEVEKDVVKSHYFDEESIVEIAKRRSTSRQRINVIKQRALLRMRRTAFRMYS